jgi:hypothetical protein
VSALLVIASEIRSIVVAIMASNSEILSRRGNCQGI